MRAAFVPQGESIPLRKPRGGYQLIPVVHLALAWWAYHEKLIRLVDLRVWFAAWEMRSRRCRRPGPLPCRFGLDELRGLTGLSPKRLRESLRRLEAARLLTWSESAIGFPASPEVVPLPDRADFRRFLDAIPNHQRLAPVPRRILRLLAGGARPALIATILGHLVRCLYLKHGKCSARGRVKASWIADTFGVSLRRVKQARKELIAMGWLIPLEARQWALNRWGSHVCINLAWSRLDGIKPDIRLAAIAPAAADGLPPAPAPGRELAPPPLPPGAESAPPDSNKEPLQGAKNQEPAAGGPAGFFISQPEEQTPEHGQTQPDDEAPIPQAASPLPVAISATSENPAPSVAPGPRSSSAPRAKCPPPGKPDLRNVVPEDLKDTGRLLELYGQAVGFGLVTASECDRLRFVAAAEHARIIGTRNPCGLFVRLVRGGLWHFATHDDEAAASVRLRRHLHGVFPQRRVEREPGIRQGRELSDDARLVQAVREVAARSGYRGDPFPLLKREKSEWTRERWDRALAELGR